MPGLDPGIHETSPKPWCLSDQEAIAMDMPQSDIGDRIARLENYRDLVQRYAVGRPRRIRRVGGEPTEGLEALRAEINKETHWVRQQIIEARCFQRITIGPPPAIGGLVANNIDPFGSMFNAPYGANLFDHIVDMINRAIGVISSPRPEVAKPQIRLKTRANFAFVAMSIDDSRLELADLLDAIKESAGRCGIQAERIDEDRSNERITDRIIESIKTAEHVIVDLTDERPNVFFEAGFAHGFGKIPIYIAKKGTNIHFDLKDYPVIFFRSFKQLKDDLEARLRALSARASPN
jgi:hypothetical protein